MPRLAVINPYQKFYALDGITPLSGGSVQFYENLTTTPLSIYSNRDLTVPQTNPYTLDAGGAINGDVFFSALATMVTYDSIGAEVETFNYVSCVDLAIPFAEWSPTTIYTDDFSIGNVVQSPVDGNYYISIGSPNLNHEPSVSPTWWEPYFDYLIKIQSLVPAKSVAVGNATTGLAGVAIANGRMVIGDTSAGVAALNVTAKGSVAAGTGSTMAALAVGANGTILYANSAQTTGLEWAAPPSAITNVQEFSGSGTWTKPAGAVSVLVELWAGGGGGGGQASSFSGGGGGGGYAIFLLAASACGATESVTIGAGGAGGTAGDGSAGGNTTFGSLVTARGGRGGQGGGSGNGGDSGDYELHASNAAGTSAWSSAAGGSNNGVNGSAGGACIMGGAGGGSGAATTSGIGGVSLNGGNGGDGRTTAGTAIAGSAKGGGGGGAYNGTGGAGGAGYARVTAW